MATASQSASLASTIVARFLRSNNYTDTLNTFIREAGLSTDVGQTDSGDDWTIEGVLEEKKAFDKSINFERYNEDEKKDVWTVPGMSFPIIQKQITKCISTIKTNNHPNTNIIKSPSCIC